MFDELMLLYQEMLLDHNRHPRNLGTLDTCHTAKGHNPLCGDQVDIYVALDELNETITDIRFTGNGCAISTASASLMTEALKGKTLSDAKHLFEQFHAKLTGETDQGNESLGKLDVLLGVREFPTRVKCATLAWHTFQAALKHSEATTDTPPVKTE